jgi:hypothetical protein
MTSPVTPGALPGALSDLLPGVPARLVPATAELIWALRTGGEREIAAAFGQATAIAGGGVRGLRALALLLAAMVPDDEAPPTSSAGSTTRVAICGCGALVCPAWTLSMHSGRTGVPMS